MWRDRTPWADADPSAGESGPFIELGVNRLARDLFLLTAVYALFLVIVLSATFQVAGNASWSREVRAVESDRAASGLVLGVHLRKDGRIRFGDQVVATPEALVALLDRFRQERPAYRDARVLLNVYREIPSVRTADLIAALAGGGFPGERIDLRLTDE